MPLTDYEHVEVMNDEGEVFSGHVVVTPSDDVNARRQGIVAIVYANDDERTTHDRDHSHD